MMKDARQIRRSTMACTVIVAVCLPICATVVLAEAGVVPDYSPGEYKYMPGLYAMAMRDEAGALAECNRIIEVTPDAGVCRLLRADIEMQRGHLTPAEGDLLAVIALDGSYTAGALDRLADLYSYRGDKKAQAKTYRRLVGVYEAAEGPADALADAARAYEARALELEGNAKRAVDVLRTIGGSAPASRRKATAELYVAQLYVRMGSYKEAVKIYGTVIPVAKKAMHGAEVMAMQMEEIDALWAMGDRRKALDVAVDALESALAAPGKFTGIIPRAAATVHILTMYREKAGDDDPRGAGQLVRASSKRLRDRSHSVEGAVQAMLERKIAGDSVAQIGAVLKEAPYVEWALWSALYLGLAEPDKAGDLLKALPKGSIQKRIVEVEAKAKAATMPSRDGDRKRENGSELFYLQ